MTDRFSKLTRTSPLRTITSTSVARAFCNDWVFAYGPPALVLTDRGQQFASKFFLAVCAILGIQKLFTTAYHPRANGQVERYNRTLLNSLRNFVAENQKNWDDFSSAVTFGYNCQVHRSIGIAPMELVVSRPPVALSLENIPSEEADAKANRLNFLRKLRDLMGTAKSQLAKAQQRYKEGFDKRVRPRGQDLNKGAEVFLRVEVHKTGRNPKLEDQAHGPFRVEQNDGHTVLLRNGHELFRVSADRITRAPRTPTSGSQQQNEDQGPGVSHPSTHTQLQHPNTGNSDQQQTTSGDAQSGQPKDVIIREPEYVIDKLVDDGVHDDGTKAFKVRWYGYSAEDDTWEREEDLPAEVVRQYVRKKKRTRRR